MSNVIVMVYDQCQVFELRGSRPSTYVGRGCRDTWVKGVELRTSSPPSPTPQKCIAKHREAELFPKAGNIC
jgi:hypothetical protein